MELFHILMTEVLHKTVCGVSLALRTDYRSIIHINAYN